MKTVVILIALVMFNTGCAIAPRGAMVVDDPADLPTIQATLANRLSQIKIGMKLSEFQKIMPEAYVGGQSEKTTAYEIAKTLKYVTQDDIDRQNILLGVGSPRARSKREVLWFYFYDEMLVKWGRPQDWPDKPELILKIKE